MSDALTYLTNAFSMISTALLIPVMLGLLFGLLVACLIFGRAIRELVERLGFAKAKKNYTTALENSQPNATLPTRDGGILAASIDRITKTSDTLLVEKIVAETESHWQTQLEKLQSWVRMGPSLGLMGTLIPLGPGLLALANGDLATLSANLIIAFATTVVGVLIGLVCGGVHSVRKRWYRDDAILLTFAAERMLESKQHATSSKTPAAHVSHITSKTTESNIDATTAASTATPQENRSCA